MPGRTEALKELQQVALVSGEKVAAKLGHLAMLIAAADTMNEFEQYRTMALNLTRNLN